MKTNTEEKLEKLRSAVAFATGRLDLVPKSAEGKLCIDVRNFLLKALSEMSDEEVTNG